MTFSSSQTAASNGPGSSALYADRAEKRCEVVTRGGVGTFLLDLSAEQLEEHIELCGLLMLAAYARYEESGCFGDRGTADRWMRAQADAIKARSPAQVARMEAAKGIA